MPHATIKMFAGRSDELKQKLAAAITEAIASTLGSKDESISVSIEDIARESWMHEVYGPDIADKESYLFKKPGYGPLAQ